MINSVREEMLPSQLVAIHQPNFFPWLGYFDKIARSDTFIFLDHVQFQKTGGMWTNRAKLFIGGEVRWMTAPVDRGFHGVRAICEMEFQQGNPWREKFIKSLIANYSRCPFFWDTMKLVEPLILNSESRVSQYNCKAVMAIAAQLGLPGDKFHWSSEMAAEGQATAMLISLLHTGGASTYMCGGGADGYQDDAAFAAAGVGLVCQNFQHPVYPQAGTRGFVPGLSVIDALMNIGADGVRAVLHIA